MSDSKSSMVTKRCPGCMRILTEEHFYKNRAKKDGLASYCKECKQTENKAYYQKRYRPEIQFNNWRGGGWEIPNDISHIIDIDGKLSGTGYR